MTKFELHKGKVCNAILSTSEKGISCHFACQDVVGIIAIDFSSSYLFILSFFVILVLVMKKINSFIELVYCISVGIAFDSLDKVFSFL